MYKYQIRDLEYCGSGSRCFRRDPGFESRFETKVRNLAIWIQVYLLDPGYGWRVIRIFSKLYGGRDLMTGHLDPQYQWAVWRYKLVLAYLRLWENAHSVKSVGLWGKIRILSYGNQWLLYRMEWFLGPEKAFLRLSLFGRILVPKLLRINLGNYWWRRRVRLRNGLGIVLIQMR